MVDTFIKVIPILLAAFTALWGLYLFNKQQRFKRLQNLSGLWKTFSTSDDLLGLFTLMNDAALEVPGTSEALAATDRSLKLKYLAVLEEVTLYVKEFEVDSVFARELFQWHFAFPYEEPTTQDAFWSNLGGHAEQHADYWKTQREMAARFRPAS